MAKQLLLDNITPQTIEDSAAKSFNGKSALQAWGQSVKQHFTIVDRDLLTPPESPAEGAKYLLPASGTLTGEWSEFSANSIASFQDTVWTEITPDEGFTADILDEDITLRFGGSTWRFAYQSLRDGETIADSTAIPTVVHEGRYTLPDDGTTQNGLVGLNDGEWVEIVPGAVNCTLADGVDVSGTSGAIAYDLERDAARVIKSTDKGIIKVTRVGSVLRVTGGTDGVVVGPAVATGDSLPVFDGTTGRLLKDGGAKIPHLVNGASSSVRSISAGAITLTAAHNKVDTEGSASTDELTDITWWSGVKVGSFAYLSITSADRVVTIKSNTGAGKIKTYNDRDIVLDRATKVIKFLWNGSQSVVVEGGDDDPDGWTEIG